MNTVHIPTVGIVLGDIQLNWQESCDKIRESLNCEYEEHNDITDLSEFLEDAEPIITRTDIYNKTLSPKLWFTLRYSESDELIEFELHESSFLFIVKDLAFDFSNLFGAVKSNINSSTHFFIQVEGSEENILIESLKTNLASDREMGGDSNTLSYIYCAQCVKHLIE